jgi:hypothetical protein
LKKGYSRQSGLLPAIVDTRISLFDYEFLGEFEAKIAKALTRALVAAFAEQIYTKTENSVSLPCPFKRST